MTVKKIETPTGDYHVRPMRRRDRKRIFAPDVDDRDAKAILVCVCDADGKPAFGHEDQVDDLELPTYDALSLAVARINGWAPPGDGEPGK